MVGPNVHWIRYQMVPSPSARDLRLDDTRLLKRRRDTAGKVICDGPRLPHAPNDLSLACRLHRAITSERRQNPLMTEVLAPRLEGRGVCTGPLGALA